MCFANSGVCKDPIPGDDKLLKKEINLHPKPDMEVCLFTPEEVFVVKDSGERKEFDSGMVRDTVVGKIEWHRVADGPMLRRWAEHITKGGIKYPDVAPGIPNWTLASGAEEYQRFRQSAFRHFIQWFVGDRDEDHAAAVFFNVNGCEYVREKRSRG